MGANERGLLPSELVRGQAQFQAWRERRALGERIPLPLWSLAVRLAKTHGVSRTATALGLDYYSLKKRAAALAAAPSPTTGPTFVEFTASALVPKQCQVELSNGSGATMRVQLVGYDAADIEALARGFWNAL
jgi:hypothetical protein